MKGRRSKLTPSSTLPVLHPLHPLQLKYSSPVLVLLLALAPPNGSVGTFTEVNLSAEALCLKKKTRYSNQMGLCQIEAPSQRVASSLISFQTGLFFPLNQAIRLQCMLRNQCDPPSKCYQIGDSVMVSLKRKIQDG